ncbi:unnamed protein product, partial [Prorocentrum cordatum]
VLVGHCTHLFLLHRELLSVFSGVYASIGRHRGESVGVWDVVRRELRWASCLICFCSRDLCAPIYTRVLATDASEWGLGATETVGLEADVKHAMSFSEAWRFKEGGEGAREQARERIEEAKVTGEKAENANVPEGVDVCARLERGVDLVPRSLVGGVELAALLRAPTPARVHGAAAQPLPKVPRMARAHAGRPRARDPALRGMRGSTLAAALPRGHTLEGVGPLEPTRRRAQPRARRAAARAVARRGSAATRAPELARLSSLQATNVRPRTQQLYPESWESFEDWARFHLLPLQSEKQVDDALGDFFDYLWFEGAGSSLLSDWLVRGDRWPMAEAMLMYVVLYLKPCKALSLRRGWLVPPLPSGVKDQSRWTVLLYPAGASLVISLGRQGPPGMQHRGGWAQSSSMRRYQKAGHLMEQLRFLPHGAQLATARYASEI